MYRICLILALMMTFPASGFAQRKRALMVGISDYLTHGYKVWNNIHGAEDVALLTPVLEAKGFEVQSLTNEQATCRGILDALERCIADTKKGDIVYLHFSGHGQPVEDGMMGDEKDEEDGWDEALVPIDAGKQYDARGYRGDKHLTDDMLSGRLVSLRRRMGATGTLYVIVDACHAGNVERDDFATIRGTNEGLTPNDRNRYNPPRRAKRKRIDSSPALAHVLYVEACESYERNKEIIYQHREYGALSFNIWQTLTQRHTFPTGIHVMENELSQTIWRNREKRNYLWPGAQHVVFSKSK